METRLGSRDQEIGLTWSQLERKARTEIAGELLLVAYAPGGALDISK